MSGRTVIAGRTPPTADVVALYRKLIRCAETELAWRGIHQLFGLIRPMSDGEIGIQEMAQMCRHAINGGDAE